MDRVVQRTTLHIDVSRALEQRHQSFGRPGDPRLGEVLIVEEKGQNLKHMTRGSEGGEDVGRSSGTFKEVHRKASVRLLKLAGAVDGTGKYLLSYRPATVGPGRVGMMRSVGID